MTPVYSYYKQCQYSPIPTASCPTEIVSQVAAHLPEFVPPLSKPAPNPMMTCTPTPANTTIPDMLIAGAAPQPKIALPVAVLL